MDKRYTADEFRQIADAFEPLGVVARIHNGIVEREIFARDIVAMLRHAADLQEREEREKRYEYGVCPAGEKGFFQSRTAAELERLMLSQGGFEYPIVRREVGEWEEVG